MSEAMTGLVIADPIRCGELRLGDWLPTYIPMQGTPLADVTIEGLVTPQIRAPTRSSDHAAVLSVATAARASIFADDNHFRTKRATRWPQDSPVLQHGSRPGRQAAVRAAGVGMSCPDLMRARLFEPLG